MFVWMALVAAVAMMSTCVTSSARSIVLTSTDSLRLGLSYGDTLVWLTDRQLVETLDDAVDMGAKWVRADLSWSDVQPDSASEYKWDRFDHLVEESRSRGLALLPIITFTPPWARLPGCHNEKCAPTNAGQFAEFAGEAASRYPEIGAWEIWNEQNHSAFWQPEPDPFAYAELLKAAVASIRKSSPDAMIVIGGMANASPADGGITPQDFLTTLVQTGATRGVDGVGLHPYAYPSLASESGPWIDPEGGGLQSLRRIFTEAGLPALPIWITEYGAPTGGGSGSDSVTEERQAEMATDAVKTAAADTGVAALIWYTYHDTGSDPDDPESHYGLRRDDFSTKPAYDAFRQAIAESSR